MLIGSFFYFVNQEKKDAGVINILINLETNNYL